MKINTLSLLIAGYLIMGWANIIETHQPWIFLCWLGAILECFEVPKIKILKD